MGTVIKYEISTDYYLKDMNTALLKIEREAPMKKRGAVECFENMKDIIRCRINVKNSVDLLEVFDTVIEN